MRAPADDAVRAAVPLATAGSADAVLIVVPASVEGVQPSTSLVGGLPLIRRIVLAARAAGYAEILVRDGHGAGGPPLNGTGAAAPANGNPAAPPPRRRVVSLPANVVPQARWLRSLLEAPRQAETLYVDPALVMVVDTADPAVVLGAAAQASSAGALLAELAYRFPTVHEPAEPDGRFAIASTGDVARAEDWLLHSLVKQREGFMSRHFERRISLAITRRLAATAVTPNTMTLASAAIGLAGALFFLSSAPGWQLVGALLFLTHSILDGCDGELARLKFQQSRWGAVLDFWGDNVVHVAVFACIAIGWSLSIGAPWPLALGALAAGGALGSAATMFERTAQDRAGDNSGARLIDALSSRDFIYVVVALAAFGKAAWFLVAAAVGAPAFVLLVVWLGRHGRVR